MISFNGKEEVKKLYVDRVNQHIKMDELIRGKTWDGTKGCAIGCTLNKYDHKAYEVELGIPEWLAKLEDNLFEGMSLEKSKTWPKYFLEAIEPGIDLKQVKTPFLIIILENTLKSMDSCKYDEEKFPDVKKATAGSKQAVRNMIDAHRIRIGTLKKETLLSLTAALEEARRLMMDGMECNCQSDCTEHNCSTKHWLKTYAHLWEEK